MKLITLVLLLSLLAAPLQADPLKACDLALTACKELVTEQDNSIKALKLQVSTLEDRLADSQKDPLISSFQWAIIGFIAGGVAIFAIRR